MKKNTNNQFLIGSWVSFYPFDTDSYEDQLDRMHEAGINFNIFPIVFGGGMDTPEECDLVERQYAVRDMLYFMNGGLTEEALLRGVAYARGKAHCIGYHLKDEPGGIDLPEIGRCIRAFREADGERYPFVNLLPSYAGEAAMKGSYYEYCSRFVREAGAENIEYLSHDFYPFHMNGTNQAIFADMEVMRRVALENGRLRTHAFPQSSAWNGIRMPNIDEMRWNVYGYLAYGFKALSWFNLVCPGNSDTEGEGFRDAIIYRDGTIRNKQLFKEFGKLNREVLTLGETIMKLDTIHAYHTRDVVEDVELLPADWMIIPVNDEDFIISHMVSPDGNETYIMLFNKSWARPTTASFRISEFSGIDSMEYVSPFNGSRYTVSVRDGIFTETFRPGEGKLYKLNGKLSYRVLPMNHENPRLDVDLPSAADIVGVDVSCPLHESGMGVAIQISTNKKFTEEKTSLHLFTEMPSDGRLRFASTVAKYLRIAFGCEGDEPAYGYAELRVRFTDEPQNHLTDCGLPVSILEPASAVIPKDATLEEVKAILPNTVTAVYTDRSRVPVTSIWSLNNLNTAISGTHQIKGSVILPDGTPAPSELSARLQVTVAYDVDLTDLDEALAVVDELVEAEYSPESWKAVRDCYNAAMAMKDGSAPQNAVTVAAWQLLDRVRELEPVQWTMPAEHPTQGDKMGLHVDKGPIPTVITTLAGAIAGGFVRIFKSKKK